MYKSIRILEEDYNYLKEEASKSGRKIVSELHQILIGPVHDIKEVKPKPKKLTPQEIKAEIEAKKAQLTGNQIIIK